MNSNFKNDSNPSSAPNGCLSSTSSTSSFSTTGTTSNSSSSSDDVFCDRSNTYSCCERTNKGEYITSLGLRRLEIGALHALSNVMHTSARGKRSRYSYIHAYIHKFILNPYPRAFLSLSSRLHGRSNHAPPLEVLPTRNVQLHHQAVLGLLREEETGRTGVQNGAPPRPLRTGRRAEHVAV